MDIIGEREYGNWFVWFMESTLLCLCCVLFYPLILYCYRCNENILKKWNRTQNTVRLFIAGDN